MKDLKRSVDIIEDVGTIYNVEYNNDAGARKTIEVGPALRYESATATARTIFPGSQLFFFKTSTGIGYVTFAESGTPSLGNAPSADTFPVFSQVYTPIAASHYKSVIGTADIHLYILKDQSLVRIKI